MSDAFFNTYTHDRLSKLLKTLRYDIARRPAEDAVSAIAFSRNEGGGWTVRIEYDRVTS